MFSFHQMDLPSFLFDFFRMQSLFLLAIVKMSDNRDSYHELNPFSESSLCHRYYCYWVGATVVYVIICLAGGEWMTPSASGMTLSGSGSPRVYTELTGVGPIPPVQTPIVHHPLEPVYPQSESPTVSLSFPSFIHRRTITMLFQCILLGNSLLGRCHWAGTMVTCGVQFGKSWLVRVSLIFFGFHE